MSVIRIRCIFSQASKPKTQLQESNTIHFIPMAAGNCGYHAPFDSW